MATQSSPVDALVQRQDDRARQSVGAAERPGLRAGESRETRRRAQPQRPVGHRLEHPRHAEIAARRHALRRQTLQAAGGSEPDVAFTILDQRLHGVAGQPVAHGGDVSGLPAGRRVGAHAPEALTLRRHPHGVAPIVQQLHAPSGVADAARRRAFTGETAEALVEVAHPHRAVAIAAEAEIDVARDIHPPHELERTARRVAAEHRGGRRRPQPPTSVLVHADHRLGVGVGEIDAGPKAPIEPEETRERGRPHGAAAVLVQRHHQRVGQTARRPVERGLAVTDAGDRRGAGQAEEEAVIARRQHRPHRTWRQRRPGPGHEPHAVEPYQTGFQAEPEIAFEALRDRADASGGQSLFLGPRRHRIVGQGVALGCGIQGRDWCQRGHQRGNHKSAFCRHDWAATDSESRVRASQPGGRRTSRTEAEPASIPKPRYPGKIRRFCRQCRSYNVAALRPVREDFVTPLPRRFSAGAH